MPLSIIIADDHGFTLFGMQRMLADLPAFDVLGVTGSGIEAIALCRQHKPDIALLDFSMPDATGLEVYAEIKRWSPDTRTAILTGTVTPSAWEKIAAAGVQGIFLKNQDLSEICDGLIQIGAGHSLYAPEVRERLDRTAKGPLLSDREREVLYGIARGLTNSSIAKELSISPKTVESHRSSLMRKIRVHSTAELVVSAFRDGYLE